MGDLALRAQRDPHLIVATFMSDLRSRQSLLPFLEEQTATLFSAAVVWTD